LANQFPASKVAMVLAAALIAWPRDFAQLDKHLLWDGLELGEIVYPPSSVKTAPSFFSAYKVPM
jgi:hypothetical protein